MNVSNFIKTAYMGYVPLEDIAAGVKMSVEDVTEMVNIHVTPRAKQSLEAIDLTNYKDEPPIVKMILTKMSIMRAELFRRGQKDFSDLTKAEQLDNYIKKIKSDDTSEWIASEEEVEIIEETGNYVEYHWVFQAETAVSASIVSQGKVLMDKYLLKPAHTYAYKDWAQHVANCKEFNIAPHECSEQDMIVMLAEKDEYLDVLKGD